MWKPWGSSVAFKFSKAVKKVITFIFSTNFNGKFKNGLQGVVNDLSKKKELRFWNFNCLTATCLFKFIPTLIKEKKYYRLP